nr:amidase [Candidatus Eremiobacteraeota bacterium]
PMCRSVRDTESVLTAIAGTDVLDPTARNKPFKRLRRRPRIAIPKNPTGKAMPEVIRNFRRSVEVLREFCDVVTGFTLPDHPYGAVFGAIYNGEAGAAFRELIESGRSRELQSVDDRIGGYQFYGALAMDYVDGLRQRKILNQAVYAALEPYDAVVFPTLATVAYPVGKPFDQAYPKIEGGFSMGSSGNLAGVPALSIPNGFGENGLPTALCLVGNPWAELQVTAIAKGFQQRTSFHQQHPHVGA